MRRLKQEQPAPQPAYADLPPLAPQEPDGLLVDPRAMGAEVSWSFGDGAADSVRLDRDQVLEAFDRHGFTCDLERQLEPDESLRRAREIARNPHWLVVRELAKPNKDTHRVLGIYVRHDVTEEGEVGDGWRMVARVRWEAHTTAFAALPPEGCEWAADDRAIAGIREANRLATFANLLTHSAVNSDVSAALVQACHQATCVPRRPGGGGVYLVLAGARCEALVRLLGDLTEVASRDDGGPHAWRHRFCAQVHEVYAAPLTSRSWRISLEQQVQQSVDRLLSELEDATGGAMRESTAAKRAAEVDQLMLLAQRCGALLEERLPVIRDRLRRVGDGFRSAAAADMAAVRALLDDLPDPERVAAAQDRAARRQARLKDKPAEEPTPAPTARLERVLEAL